MDFPTDVLVEILLRLPPSARRRARLVCKAWREAVDERTTEMQSRAKPLLWNYHIGVAYVVDDLSPSSTESCSELWRSSRPHPYPHFEADLQLVSTCNGLLCLCDNETGDVTLLNPVTGETLSVPPLPCTGDQFFRRHGRRSWERAYNFGYHPTSGRYKVVHVPCSFDMYSDVDEICEFHALHVLVLGDEPSWREVPALANTKCDLVAGILSIDGTTYWVTKGSAPRVVSLSLEDDSVADFAMPSPALLVRPGNYHLTEVRGRLGVVVQDCFTFTIGVWVLEDKGSWARRYSLDMWHNLTRPHFVYGEYFITNDRSVFHAHRRKFDRSLSRDVIKVSHKEQDQGTVVACLWDEGQFCRTFPYVQTTEPLGVYAPPKASECVPL